MPPNVIELSSSPELISRALTKPTSKPPTRSTSPLSNATKRASTGKSYSFQELVPKNRASKVTKPARKRSNAPPQHSESESDGFDFNAHVFHGAAETEPVPTPVSTKPFSSSNTGEPKPKLVSVEVIPISGAPKIVNRMAQEDKAYIRKQNIGGTRLTETGAEEISQISRYGESHYEDGSGPPSAEIAPNEKTPNFTSTFEQPRRSLGTLKWDWGVDFRSDDFDTSVDLDSSLNQPSPNRSGLLGLNRKQMEEERLARVAGIKLTEMAPAKEISEPTKRKISPVQPPSRREIMEILDDTEDDMLPPLKRRQISSPKAPFPKTSGYKRCISNIETSSKPGTKKSKAAGLARSKSNLEPDPIMFTSSPNPIAEASLKRTARRKDTFSDSDDPFASDVGTSKQKAIKHPLRDSDLDPSDEDFPDLDDLPLAAASKPRFMPRLKSPPKRTEQAKPKLKSKTMTAIEEYNAEKAKERKAEEKEQKIQQKEDEKERKRLAREEKIYAKGKAAELAKVNTLRTDKKVSTPEMLVDLPVSNDAKSSLDGVGKAQGQNLATKARTFLDTLGVQVFDYENSDPVVRWRRKVCAAFNEELAIWEPVKEHIKTEKHIMYVITAKDFVELAGGDEDNDLDIHTIRLKSKYQLNDIIYLIQGLSKWMRDNKNVKNRKFQAAARSHGHEELTATGRPRKRKAEPEYVDENMVEEALLKLQVMHGMVIHHTRDLQDTSEAIRAFTQHVSTIPYKLQQQAMDTTFCMESGQVKAGDGAADTFIKMLQEMVRVTPAVAHGIVAEFPTVQKLAKAFQDFGPLAVAECHKLANKNGAFTDRLVGPAISRRLHNVFTGRDEWDDNV